MIRFIHLCLLLATVLSYLPPWINPDLTWPVSTLGLLAPSLWFITLLFAVYWLLKSDRRAWFSGIVLLLGWSMVNNAFALPDGNATTTSKEVRIVSLNGHGFRIDTTPEKQKDHTAITAYIDSLEVDILCIQEFLTQSKGNALAKAIQAKTELKHAFRDSEGRMAIFSRYPLENGRVSYFQNRVNGYLQVDVISPLGKLHICNAHLQTNAISRMAQAVTQHPDIREKSTWRTIKTMFARYGRSNTIRTEQSRQIIDELQKVKTPTVVCGDFNEVPTSYLYRLFRKQYKDAHLAQAWGLGTTYQGLLPGLRIDYILTDYSLNVQDFERIQCWFSDHHAVKAVINQ